MTTTQQTQVFPENHPLTVVRNLLHQPTLVQPTGALAPIEERGVAMLERRAPETVMTARQAGVEIEHLGVAPLFSEPRFYEGSETDWVLAPADPYMDRVVPRPEGRDLRRLKASGVDLPLIYIAHELEQDKTVELRAEAAAGRRELTPAQAAELVGPTPPPQESVALGDRLAQRSVQVRTAVRRTAQVAGAAALGVVALPVAVVGGALASLATLDPIILGAMPAVSEKPGAPASWFVLVRWDW